MVVSAALRNQVERAAVPVLESFRIELIRVLPYSRIMHCTVNIQSKHSVFFEMIAFIFEVFFHFTRQIRYERSEERRVGKEWRDRNVTGVQTCALPILVSAALRNQVERAAVPVLESFRIELIRVLPYSRIMHCTVNIQSKHSVFFEMIAFIFEVFFHFTRQIRYE